MKRVLGSRWFLILVFVFFIFLCFQNSWWEKLLHVLFPTEKNVLHPGSSLIRLLWDHLLLVLTSSFVGVSISLSFGILITRPQGIQYRDTVNQLTALGQTIPPIAVIALMVPVMGFGFAPAFVALILYGMFPVLRNTVTGLRAVPPGLVEAGLSLGMTPFQILLDVEFPLAFPVILAGIRTSFIVNIGTAAIGATVGSGGLGVPIISGLVNNNSAYVFEGAIPLAILAILSDLFFESFLIEYSRSEKV